MPTNKLQSLRLLLILLSLMQDSLTEVLSGREQFWDTEKPPEIDEQGVLVNHDLVTNIDGDDSQLNSTKEHIASPEGYCYQDTNVAEPFINQEHRTGNQVETMRERRPAEFVVIRDGGSRCHAKKECRRQIISLRMSTTNSQCNLRENFYVGGDGTVYEGRGWIVSPYWSLNGMRNISITFMFLGEYHNETPTRDAQAGFEAALTGGVWMGKLSPNYKIVSFRDILNQSQFLGDGFHKSLKNWDGWVNDTVFSSRWEYLSAKWPKLVFRRHWNASKPVRRLEPLEHPVKVIFVSNGGSRCQIRPVCIIQVKEEQNTMMSQYGDLLENFYIGDDGSVYEGRGWNVSSHWRLGNLEKLVSVQFLGTFQNELPSEQAINAFKSLANTGVDTGKLDVEFGLVSLRLLYNDSSLLGDTLTHYMGNWTPWRNKYNAMSEHELLANDILPIIKQNRWSRVPKHDQFRGITFPITFVIVVDGGEPCFTYSQCSKLMNKEKSNHTKKYGDLPHNFYIGSDGYAYEGRGWEYIPHLRLTILKYSYITVKFLGSYGDRVPNGAAFRGFNALINHGIHAGLISLEYQLYSYRHIYDEPTYLGDALSHYLEGTNHWSSSWNLAKDDEREIIGSLPLVLRKNWSSESPFPAISKVSEPIDYVVVSEVGKHCFSREQCVLEMLAEENRTIPLYGNVPDNFYIGMDGIAYEGMGWRMDPYSVGEGIASKLITISFIGKFEIDMPTDLAMSAFKSLLKCGESTGKLSENYRIVSARQLFNQTHLLGMRLHQELMSWEKWVGDVNETFLPLRNSMARLMMVPRLESELAERYAPKRAQEYRSAEYIVVSSKGDRCFSRQECGHEVATKMMVRKYDGYVDNFFIAEDGFVYEGLGWDLRSILNLSCTDCSFLTVVFLGSYNEESPSPNTTDTFNFLVKWGVGLGKISPDFRVLSIRQLCGNTTDIGDALHRHVSSGKHWSGNAGLTADCHPKQRLVTHSEWKGYSIMGYKRNHLPIENIFVIDRGERCYSEAHCRDIIRYEHLVAQESDCGVQENFYIGDDGNVYEGRGWGRRPQYEFNFPNKSMNVLFFGDFEHEPLSKLAMAAFENIVIKHGLQLGKLSPHFNIRVVPDGMYPTNAGRELKKFVRSWNRV